MNGFSVKPGELRSSATVVYELLDECTSQPAAKYWSDPGSVGDRELAAALSEFQRTSVEVSAVLLADSMELADRLRGIATGYELTDATVADSFTEIRDR